MILSCVGFQSDRRSDSIIIEFKNTKLGHKGALPGSCEYFSNFGTPSYLCNGWRYKPQILHAYWW